MGGIRAYRWAIVFFYFISFIRRLNWNVIRTISGTRRGNCGFIRPGEILNFTHDCDQPVYSADNENIPYNRGGNSLVVSA